MAAPTPSDPLKTSHLGWSKEQCEFCVEQYYLNSGLTAAVRQLFCEKFRVINCDLPFRCPSSVKIKQWVRIHEDNGKLGSLTEVEEEQKRNSSKLKGTQWGRKTGENRIIRTESIDMGEQHQAIKWKQRDTKWSGPRPFNEKQKKEEPVVEERPYWWYYNEPVEEEVKPDKKQVLKEKFEEEIVELIASLNAPGHAARAGALVSLRAALQRRAVDGLLGAHRATLADHVARALRRGKDGERKAAAAIAPLLALQIGEEGIEQFVREVKPALSATATDKSASLDTRTECCSSLAVLCYLVEEDLTDILKVMRMYETIFSGSYPKVSDSAVEEGLWHAAALDGWALLLPLLSPNHALSLLNNHAPSFARLGEMLEAASLEVCLAAGSALAIAFEAVADDDNSSNPLAQHVDALVPRLNELARDTNKLRARRDLKIQRATFRAIFKYFEEGTAPCGSAQPGCGRGWWRGAAHAALAAALAGALPVLAPRCVRLRTLLQLPAEAPQEVQAQEKSKKLQHEKPKKLQRHLQHKAASKARNNSRNENRDKRSAGLIT